MNFHEKTFVCSRVIAMWPTERLWRLLYEICIQIVERKEKKTTKHWKELCLFLKMMALMPLPSAAIRTQFLFDMQKHYKIKSSLHETKAHFDRGGIFQQ